MKDLIFARIFLFVLTVFLCSFMPGKKPPAMKFNVKTIDKSLVKINLNVYACKYELSNLQYGIFLSDLAAQNKTELLKKVLPDSLNWRDRLSYNEPMVELYFRHPAYSNYPVVNLSYESALAYCEWLTNSYNSNPKRKFKKVQFRLPTVQEWELAAKGGMELINYAWGNKILLNGKLNCNYHQVGDENLTLDSVSKQVVLTDCDNYLIPGSLSDNADITAPVDSYQPNAFGLYNVCGNVAEMVQQKGLVKGGGWKSLGGDVRIKSRAYYIKSATDIGFRVFMEVLE